MKNTTISVVIAILVLAGGIFLYTRNSIAENNSSENDGINTGETQKITLSMKNGNYYPNTITLKSNVPAEITLDNSVAGCYRSFTIRDLGISKYSRSPSETIKFTPTQKGRFRFSCSMGMGTGTLIVE